MARVAIIGAGPSGLSQLIAFQAAARRGAAIPEIVCFEKQDEIGGMWVYSHLTGLDHYGEPVHGCMYRHLRINAPVENCEYPDYKHEQHYGRKCTSSYPPRDYILDYLNGRAKSYDVLKSIRLHTVVRSVQYEYEPQHSFLVKSEDLQTHQQITERFNYVIIATGHFSTPNIPHIEGLSTFQGKVLHSRDIRQPDEFKGKDVLVVGASYSAEDIASMCYKFGAKSITLSWRTKRMRYRWPETFSTVPMVSKVEGRTIHFKDDQSKQVDVVILCTGYVHHFPFLANDLRLITDNRAYVGGLYKGVVWMENPQLMYLGMQNQAFSLLMFDVQAWYCRDVILGKVKLPGKDDMRKDVDRWREREQLIQDLKSFVNFQCDYVADLMEATDYPKFDVEGAKQNFHKWDDDKVENIITFRDKTHRSVYTGDVAKNQHVAWLEEIDDSVCNFLSS